MDHYQFLEALRRIHDRANARLDAPRVLQAGPEAEVPRDAKGWHALALARQQAGQRDEALAAWRQALACPIHKLKLVVAIERHLRELGQDPAQFLDPDDFQGPTSDAVQSAPTRPSLPRSLVALALRGDWSAVLPFLEAEFKERPLSQRRADNLALVLAKLGQEARARCVQAATLAKQEHWQAAAEAFLKLPLADVLAYEVLALMLRALHHAGMEQRALELAATAAELGQCDARARNQWAMILLDLDREQEALAVLRSGAAELDDWWLRLQSGLALAPVPASTSAVATADVRVCGFIRELEQLALPTDAEGLESLARALEPNFYLAYREQPNLDPIRRYGQFASRVIAARHGSSIPVQSRLPGNGRKIRIGYVTRHATVHSVTRHFAGWFGNFEGEGFETHLFPLSIAQDWMSLYLRGQVDVHHPPTQDFETAVRAIQDARLDLLVHLAIGMDPLTYQIAALRLAPVQCALWGHPVSTGLPAVDYFISAGGMEPEDGNAHYTERLVTLPGIGLTLPEAAIPPTSATRATLDIPQHAVAFVSAQSLFKYLPQHDALYPRIAREVPGALFLFAEGDTPAWTRTFRKRIESSFHDHGLSADDHVRIIPRCSLEAYHDLLQCCDAMLDTLDWSGGQTSYDAIACGLPIVTLPGRMMRGRQTCGILRQIGVEDTIACDRDDYIRIAARLGNDRGWRDDVARRIRERTHLLYDDVRPVRALEAFYRWAAGVARPGDEELFKLWPPGPSDPT